MKSIKTLFIIAFILNVNFIFSQTENVKNIMTKKLSFKTNFRTTFYHLPSFQYERSTFFLEQHISYRIHPNFSFGGGVGINSYAFLFALPVFVDAQVYVPFNKFELYYYQSYARNIKIADIFFDSNRLLGTIGTNIKLSKKLALSPELGYNMLFDEYGAATMSFLVGIGLKY